MGYTGKVVNKKNIIMFMMFVVFGSSPIYSMAGSEPKYKSNYIGQEKGDQKLVGPGYQRAKSRGRMGVCKDGGIKRSAGSEAHIGNEK
jgi:hypothetical protein